MFDDCTGVTKMNNDKNKEDYSLRNAELEQKCFIAWSPLEERKLLFKHRYVSCSRSVPRKSKRFARYRLSRSLNFDTSISSSTSENSCLEEEKHLSRSAKIMRALNFTSSPSYYGKAKIKKSLNFNLTPSPKRFMPRKKNLRKSLSTSFNSISFVSDKCLHFNDNPNDSANNLFSSSESIDENQNETPFQQNAKEHDVVHYSTPNAKLIRQALHSDSFSPLLRSRLKDTIDKIVYVNATPNSQSFQHVKARSKCVNGIAMNTSRNLYHEFDDKEDDRPCTPENVICLIPESMSAIKRSHKKERSSRRNNFAKDDCVLQNTSAQLLFQHSKDNDLLQDYESIVDRCCEGNSDSNEVALKLSEDDMSDTGSLFDYRSDQQEHVQKHDKDKSRCVSNYINTPNAHEVGTKEELEGDVECFSATEVVGKTEVLREYNDTDESGSASGSINLGTRVRSVTPELMSFHNDDSQRTVTPENRINILQRVANESIKKSHKKTKDSNKRRLFSAKVSQTKLEVVEKEKNSNRWQNFDEYDNVDENKIPVEENCIDTSKGERPRTPQNVNSSRILLSQFNSVKKSHKKDKHNKILSGFLKRQEYFNIDMDTVKSHSNEASVVADMSHCRNSTDDLSSDLDMCTNINDCSTTSSTAFNDTNTSLENLSPNERKKALNRSLECAPNVSSDSELQQFDGLKEEFKIYTPLKRKRSAIASTVVKEYLHSYDDIPSDKSDLLEEGAANISFSRCLTPVAKFQSVYANTEDADGTTVKYDDHIVFEEEDGAKGRSPNDATGRSTPRDILTTELYVNLDSIKKSHKKNKRGNGTRTGLSFAKNSLSADTSMEYADCNLHSPVDFGHDFGAECNKNITNKSIIEKSVDHDNAVESTMFAMDKEAHASTSTENVRSNVTPPNCLKTKNYMRLLRETSIKRSHKKVRDKKRQGYKVDTNELSDDGSIFGDDGKSDFVDN